MKKRVIKIPLTLPVFIIIICVIIATVFFGKELISNAARYTASNAFTSDSMLMSFLLTTKYSISIQYFWN